MDKIKNQLQVSVSGFVDEGDGVVSFPNGLTITDDSVMRSGTRYDVSTLGIEEYQGTLTGDHVDSLGTLIGKTMGVVKNGNRVTVDSIKYAVKENPYARLAYDLLIGGFSNSFSIETIGRPADDDGVYRNHELIGLSQVVVPNNYNAKINQFNEIVHNSLERSQQDGLDTTGIEEKIYSSVELKSSDPVEEESMKDKKMNASEIEEAAVQNEAVEEAEVEVTGTNEDGSVEAVVDGEEVTLAPADEETAEAVLDDEAETTTETTVEKAENGTWVETKTVTTTTSSEYIESEEEKAERKAREARWEEELKAEKEKESDATVTVRIETDNEAEDKVENDAEEAEEADAEEAEEVENSAENKTNKKEEILEMTADQIAEIVANAVKPIAEDLAATKELAQNALDAQAKEPEFEKVEEAANSYDDMDADELFAKQLNAAVAAERMNSVEGRKTLNEINARNLEALKAEKIVNRALTIEDLGNFVIGPELYREIVGGRNDYSAILDATQWKETNSIEFGWLTRGDDIDMQNVAIGAFGDVPSPDTTNNRLKPVSMPGYGAHSDKLEEMAAVTPISINVIKFAAVDILSDVADGYRNDYDRKRAQLVIARLQQAVDETGQKHSYDMTDGLVGWAEVVALVSDATTIGSLVFNNKTLTVLKSMAIREKNTSVLSEIASGSILGTPFIVVPNDLMPSLNSTEEREFFVKGEPVTVDQAVFYGDLRTFTGRTSGGLKYDVDGSASYEIGGVTYSAYQRNEVVLRGSFFRGGVVKDPSVIASIAAVAIS